MDPDGKSPIVVLATLGFVAGSLNYMLTHEGSGWSNVGNTYAHGALWAASAATLGEYTVASGTLRVAASSGALSATAKRFIVGTSTSLGDQLLDNPNSLDFSSALTDGALSNIRIPFGNDLKGGTFASTKNLFTRQNMYESRNYISSLISGEIASFSYNYAGGHLF